MSLDLAEYDLGLAVLHLSPDLDYWLLCLGIGLVKVITILTLKIFQDQHSKTEINFAHYYFSGIPDHFFHLFQ